jgi:hypothetical protein
MEQARAVARSLSSATTSSQRTVSAT